MGKWGRHSKAELARIANLKKGRLKLEIKRVVLFAKSRKPRPSRKKKVSAKPLEGRRVISCKSMIRAMKLISEHSKICKKLNLSFSGEKNFGIETQIQFECDCGWEVQLRSDFDLDAGEMPINEGLAWGCVNSPMGHSDLTTLLTCLHVPPPSWFLYKYHQDQVGVQLIEVSNASMNAAAEEERRLATENGEFVNIEGVQYAAITVIVDGGWAVRSYGKSYRSNYGCAAIIGQRTGKVLFFGTRQKACYWCKRRGDEDEEEHENCPRNWIGPSTSMEPDIIQEGFSRSIIDHQLVYKDFIGDGDSSVHKAVQKVYPDYEVTKIECTNHVMRNVNSQLTKISGNTEFPLSERKIKGMAGNFAKFERILRYICSYYHDTADHQRDWKKLFQDVRNIPFHVFGRHTQCQPFYCDHVGFLEPDYLKVQNTKIFKAIVQVFQRPANVARSLIKKLTSNKVETFMSCVAKFIEGKRKNMGGGRLYPLRVAGAVLSFNHTTFFTAYAFRVLKGKSPCSIMKKREMRSNSKRLRKKSTVKPRRLDFRSRFPKEQEDPDYGSNPDTVQLPEEELNLAIAKKHEELQVTPIQQTKIEKETHGQAMCEAWHEHRRERITASIAHRICHLQDHTTNTSVIKQILGLYRPRGRAIDHGIGNEGTAVKAYMDERNLSEHEVTEAGLVIFLEDGILAASPDRWVGTDGMVEVKCPYVLRSLKPNQLYNHHEIALKEDDGEITINKEHHHFYQIVVQLQITQREWCDYVIWTEKGILIHRIFKSDTDVKWQEIKPILQTFWWNELAPELVDPQLKRNLDCRQPLFRIEARRAYLEKQAQEKFGMEKKFASKLSRTAIIPTKTPPRPVNPNLLLSPAVQDVVASVERFLKPLGKLVKRTKPRLNVNDDLVVPSTSTSSSTILEKALQQQTFSASQPKKTKPSSMPKPSDLVVPSTSTSSSAASKQSLDEGYRFRLSRPPLCDWQNLNVQTPLGFEPFSSLTSEETNLKKTKSSTQLTNDNIKKLKKINQPFV